MAVIAPSRNIFDPRPVEIDPLTGLPVEVAPPVSPPSIFTPQTMPMPQPMPQPIPEEQFPDYSPTATLRPSVFTPPPPPPAPPVEVDPAIERARRAAVPQVDALGDRDLGLPSMRANRANDLAMPYHNGSAEPIPPKVGDYTVSPSDRDRGMQGTDQPTFDAHGMPVYSSGNEQFVNNRRTAPAPAPKRRLPFTGDHAVTTPYGEKGDIWRVGYHPGIDYATPMNTAALAVSDGVIESVSRDEHYGINVHVRHGEYTAIYGHLNRADVRKGDTVKAGQPVGLTGNTGKSTGPHLHFEVRKNGKIVDPDELGPHEHPPGDGVPGDGPPLLQPPTYPQPGPPLLQQPVRPDFGNLPAEPLLPAADPNAGQTWPDTDNIYGNEVPRWVPAQDIPAYRANPTAYVQRMNLPPGIREGANLKEVFTAALTPPAPVFDSANPFSLDNMMNAVPAIGPGGQIAVRGLGPGMAAAADVASGLLGGPGVASARGVIGGLAAEVGGQIAGTRPRTATAGQVVNPFGAGDDAGKSVDEVAETLGGVRPPDPTPPDPPRPEPPKVSSAQPRAFAQTVREAPDTPAAVREALEADPGSYYTPTSNKASAQAAQDMIARDLPGARTMVLDGTDAPDAVTSAVGQLLVKQAQDAGDFDEAVRLTEAMAKRATEAGQFIQALSMYGRLTPEGVLRWAQRTVKQAQDAGAKGAKLTPEKAQKLVAKAERLQALTPEELAPYQNAVREAEAVAAEAAARVRAIGGNEALTTPAGYRSLTIYSGPGLPGRKPRKVDVAALQQAQAQQAAANAGVQSAQRQLAQAQKSERARTLLAAEIVGDVRGLVPVPFWRKVATFQTVQQLLNTKTLIRNIGGNFAFAGFENATRLVAVGLDLPVSLLTGKRSTALTPNMLPVFGGMRSVGRGLREGAEEVWHGVNIPQLGTQFEAPVQRVFGTTPVLSQMETALGMALRVPDRAFYQAAFDDSLLSAAWVQARNEGLKGAKLGERTQALLADPTKDMIELARGDALFRTFQDDNVASYLFQGIKKSLNLGKEFGMGDFILKYPKTPASLLVRAAEYSPFGFLESAAYVFRGAMGWGKHNQKGFVESVARATIGTAGLTGFGYVMASNGLLTGRASKDPDVRAQANLQGMGQYRFNVTGFTRWVANGFDPAAAKLRQGDTWMTYDWIQPMAVSVAIGAQAALPEKKTPTVGPMGDGGVLAQMMEYGETALDVLAVGVDTLAQQPMIQNVRRVFGGDNPVQSMVNVLKDMPASFVATALSQVNQVFDNTQRDTYSADAATEAFNRVLAKIPILSASLPASVDVWGDERDRYHQDGNNPFNVFVNPSFVSQYFPRQEAAMLLELQAATGQTSQFPRDVPNRITITQKGQTATYILSAEQAREYQVLLGQMTREAFGNLADNKNFRAASPDEQVEYLGKVLTALNTDAKELLRERYQEAKGGITPLPPPEPKKSAREDLNSKNVVDYFRFEQLYQRYENVPDVLKKGNRAYRQADARHEALAAAATTARGKQALADFEQYDDGWKDFQSSVRERRRDMRERNRELEKAGVRFGKWKPLYDE